MATESIRNDGVRHERRDANIPALAAFGAAIVLSVGLVMIFSLLLFKAFMHALPAAAPDTPFASSRPLPPEPRLETAPRLDLSIYLDEQRSQLATYGWTDRQNGIVRIPIERAMQLLLQQGLPTRAASPVVTANRAMKSTSTRSAHPEIASRPAISDAHTRSPGRR